MFEASVEPKLKGLNPGGQVILSRVFRTTGLPESQLNEKIRDLFENSTNPTVAVLAHAEGVDIRLTARAVGEAAASTLIDGLGKKLTGILPQHIYGWDRDDLETIVGRLLTTRNLTLSVAESLTGGLVTHRLTQVPGSTRYFRRGYVTYSNESKTELLGVPTEVLRLKGAVSRETAVAMARGCLKADKSDLGLATTGIAGPAGGSAEKPVGLVFVALADEHKDYVREFRFTGTRDAIKRKSAQAALEMVRRRCLEMAVEE
jgi:nicotinamide-nucleotide amidase